MDITPNITIMALYVEHVLVTRVKIALLQITLIAIATAHKEYALANQKKKCLKREITHTLHIHIEIKSVH